MCSFFYCSYLTGKVYEWFGSVLGGIESMYSLHYSRGNLRQRTGCILPGLAMGPSCLGLNRGCPLVWHEPSLLCFLKALHLLNACSFCGRSVFLMEPEPRFLFFSPPHPNTCPHCSLAPRDTHINKRGDLLECSPKGTLKEQLSCWDWINGIWIITARTVHACELRVPADCVCTRVHSEHVFNEGFRSGMSWNSPTGIISS